MVVSVYTFSLCTVRTTIAFPDSANHTFITNKRNSVTFRCIAYGIPAPSISWRRLSTNQTLNSVNDSRIVVGDPTMVTVFQSAASGDVEQVDKNLTLNDAQDEDSGSYECVASNMVGSGGETDSDQQEFQLYVRGECVVVYVRGECVVVYVRGECIVVFVRGECVVVYVRGECVVVCVRGECIVVYVRSECVVVYVRGECVVVYVRSVL